LDLVAALDIIIVNWNAGALLRECLTAIAGSTIAEQLNVFVVDNASVDGSADALEFPPLALSAIRNPTNRGFAVACNQGARAGNAPNLLFLNPDVRVERDTLARALAYLNDASHAQAGIIGIRLVDREGHTSRNCARRPTAGAMLLRTFFLDRIIPRYVPPHFLTEWDHADTRPVDQIMGAFLMIRRPLFERLGGFDERFFVYYEDLDLCLRAADEGYQVIHLAEPMALHHGGGTTVTIKDRRFCYEATSRVLFMAKHHGTAMALLLAFLVATIEVALRTVYATLARSPRDGWLMLRGAAMFWAGLPRLVWSIVAGPAPKTHDLT
jgi:N-acetylglucosaminyl-diphospho-decaprenol L-rhamnosyltransferase